jgi:RHS repeat-associated protein
LVEQLLGADTSRAPRFGGARHVHCRARGRTTGSELIRRYGGFGGVPITVNATDSDGTVTLVEFFGDGALLGATSTAPFGFTWSNVAAGPHTITARATDNRNGQTTSAPVSITVNNPPTATLTAPLSGASFNPPATVTLAATASDTDGTVVKVEFYQGALLIGTATAAPYAASWSVLAPGTYTLTAKAYDNLGGTGVSAPVSVTVAGSVTFLHNDFAGNPIAATDANGALLWKENFRPYGDRLNNPAAASGNRQWFHGKPADADTGLSYFGARYYDPTVGRFMGVDTVGLDPTRLYTFNRYAYGNNNPYKYVDPDGRFAREAVVLASVFAVAVIISSTDARKQLSDGLRALLGALHSESQAPNETPGDKGSSQEGAESGEKPNLVEPDRAKHILEGDESGGGHRPGTGKPGKSEFPGSWSDEKILGEISDVATDPKSQREPAGGGRQVVRGTREGVDIKVVTDKGGKIITGYPTNTPRNPE